MRLALDLGPIVVSVGGGGPPSAAAVTAPVAPSAPARERHLRALPDRESSPRSAHGGRTLEDLLTGAWEDLAEHRAASCPICDGAMAPRYGAGPTPVGGRCRDCGTELA